MPRFLARPSAREPGQLPPVLGRLTWTFRLAILAALTVTFVFLTRVVNELLAGLLTVLVLMRAIAR